MASDRVSEHYDERYFAWQATGGEFGGWANLTKFSAFIRPQDDVLDFGCGGGYLLKNLGCRRRVGVEVNSAAHATARSNGVEVYAATAEAPDDYVDVVISNHALEHTLRPLDELKALYSKLRPGGRVVFVVPCENVAHAYVPNDINHHLYSWSPMCLGNLFTEAGYRVIESKPYIHKWPPYHRQIARFGGRAAFDLACRAYGRIERSWAQVRIVAAKGPPSR
ncbi:MAG: class I SAM-dependent methyltransferase [Anaerolineae bacterium]